MNIKQIHALYFSLTGGTEDIVRLAAQSIGQQLGLTPLFADFTSLESR